MKNIFFIYPNPNRTTPRGIRVNNILKNLITVDKQNKYHLLTFSNKLLNIDKGMKKVNIFNFIYLIMKHTGFLKYSRKFSSIATTLDPTIFLHFLIKLDIKYRVNRSKSGSNCVFVVIVSPFASYLLTPWLRTEFPQSKIVCDIGDPLFKNAARWNNDNFSRNIESNSLASTDVIIVTNKDTSDQMQKEYQFSKNNIFVIEQGVNTDLVKRAEREVVGIEKNSLVYAGAFYKNYRSPDNLFQFLSGQNRYKLYLFGNHNISCVENVFCMGSFMQENLFKEIHKKEIIVYIDNISGTQTSGKIFEVLSFKKPILFIKGKVDSLPCRIAATHPNVFFADNTPNSIESALKEVSKSSEIKYSEYYQYSWRMRAEKFREVIDT